MPRNITGAQAVSDVLRVVGLPAPLSVADSQDATVRQMWQLATEAGQQLLTDYNWSFLNRELFIETQVGQTGYPLPTDWDKFIPDSQWNRTSRLPMLGNLQPWEWEMLKARNVAGTTFALMFRVNPLGENLTIQLYEAPSTQQTLVLPYRSRGWVSRMATAPGDPFVDFLANNSDVVLFDSQLFKLKLKLLWLAEKRFDTTRAQMEFDQMLAKATAEDVPARTLSLRVDGGYPYLGVLNTPDTRYGA